MLLFHTRVLEFEVIIILLYDYYSRIHGYLNYNKWFRFWKGRATPDYHTTITVFVCWFNVPFANLTGHTASKNSIFFLVFLVQNSLLFCKHFGSSRCFERVASSTPVSLFQFTDVQRLEL